MRTLPLEPKVPERSTGTIDLAARAGGILVGAVVQGAFRTWVASPGGHLTLVVWPSGFTARFDPHGFELLDERDQAVATGGEHITLDGGFLVKDTDKRKLGHESVFITSASKLPRLSAALERP
jgi:hypothetical protein